MAEPRKVTPGFFITGTDTNVGKTYVGCLIAKDLAHAGHRVGVYKPAASGCRAKGQELISDDALSLWKAAGKPGALEDVCPQRFLAPLAPHLAAQAEGRVLDAALLRTGFDCWRRNSTFVLAEGAGGLLSPMSEQDLVADLALDLGLPLVIVARNTLGSINQTLQTLAAAAQRSPQLKVAGIVLNTVSKDTDASCANNAEEISRWTKVPILLQVPFKGSWKPLAVDWQRVWRQAQRPGRSNVLIRRRALRHTARKAR